MWQTSPCLSACLSTRPVSQQSQIFFKRSSFHVGGVCSSSLVVNGWVGRAVNTMLFSDRAGLCSHWQLVTAAHIHGVLHCIAGWILRMNSTIVLQGNRFSQNTRLLFISILYNGLLKLMGLCSDLTSKAPRCSFNLAPHDPVAPWATGHVCFKTRKRILDCQSSCLKVINN